MAASTASTLARDTCAVPSRVKRWPSGLSIGSFMGSVAETLEQVAVGVDATVAQEGPDAAHVFAARQVDVGDQQFGRIARSLGDELALRPEHVAAAPEVDAAAADRRSLVPDPIAAQHRQAVGDRMA